MRPGDQCDAECTVDCGHCKGCGFVPFRWELETWGPYSVDLLMSALYSQKAERGPLLDVEWEAAKRTGGQDLFAILYDELVEQREEGNFED